MKHIKCSIVTARLSFFVVFLCAVTVFSSCRKNEPAVKPVNPKNSSRNFLNIDMLKNDYYKDFLNDKNPKVVKNPTDIADSMDID